MERHKICEASEHKRFTAFVQYPSRRGRGSRNEAGPSTPESASVEGTIFREDMNSTQSIDDVGRRRSSTVSTASVQTYTLPSTPNPDEAFRKRSSSISVRRSSSNATFDDSLDVGVEAPQRTESVEPWPERNFPLSEAEYEEMKRVLPSVEVKESNSLRRLRTTSSRVSLNDLDSELIADVDYDSRAGSPAPSLSSGATEDPDDPDWGAAEGTEHTRPSHKSCR